MFKIISCIVLICLQVSLYRCQIKLKNNTKCRILAIEAGGIKGSWESGAIKGIVNTANASEVEWDIMSGTSAGSLNSGGGSQFDIGDEKNMADYLVDIWSPVTRDIMFKFWNGPIFGFIRGFLFEKGMVDTNPLRKYLEDNLFAKTPKRQVIMGITNMDTGLNEAVYIPENITEVLDLMMASSAIPIAFPYKEYKGQYYDDGGTSNMINFHGPIKYCKDIGYQEKDIIVDSILATKHDHDIVNIANYNSLDVFWRAWDIGNFQNAFDDLLSAQRTYKDVNFRYLAMPSEELPGSNFDFTNADIRKQIEIGLKDGVNAVNDHRSWNQKIKAYRSR